MGVTVDCVSLGKLPLHIVPVFSYRSASPADLASVNSKDDPGAVPNRFRARIGLIEKAEETRRESLDRSQSYPHSIARLLDMNGRIKPEPVIDPLFVDVPAASIPLSTFFMVPPFLDSSFYSRQPDKPFRSDRFMPRMRMRAVESLAVVAECENSSISLHLLPPSKSGKLEGDREARRLEREAFDMAACRGTHALGTQKRSKKMLKKVEIASQVGKEDDSSDLATERRNDRGRTLLRQPSTIMPVTTMTSSQPQSTVLPETAKPSLVAPIAPLAMQSKRVFSSALMARISAQATANTPQPDAPSLRTSAASWLGLIAGRSRAPSGQQSITEEQSVNGTDFETDSVRSSSRRGSSPASIASFKAALDSSPKALPISIHARRLSSRSASRPAPSSPSASSASSNAMEDESSSDEQDDDFLNPFHPASSKHTAACYRFQRWSQALDQRVVKWKSLCTPAQLPLYIDYLPSADELSHHYDSGEYFIPIKPGMSSFFIKAKDTEDGQAALILRELISHRLLQGFQLVKLPRGERDAASIHDLERMLYKFDFSSSKPVRVMSVRALADSLTRSTCVSLVMSIA
jgi:hypothetical protein